MQRLKYQNLIDEQKLNSDCPNKNCRPVDNLEAFRWSFNPIAHEDNFLPKLLYDRKKGIPTRINSSDDSVLCSCCALSMFSTLEKAKTKFESIPKLNRKLLGYTHIAKGVLTNDGLISQINNQGHFDFFEYEEVDLKAKFVIIEELNK